jgi:chromosome partitioning protein
MKVPFVLTVSNRKGGTGKTTTAVNLAAEGAARGWRVLLIDLDTQGNSAFGVGVKVTKSMLNAHRIFNDKQAGLVDAILEDVVPNLDFIPADVDFNGIGALQDVHRLKQALSVSEIQTRYDLIVLDTPPSLDLLLMNAMAVAKGVVIPLVPHFLSAEGVKQLSRLFFRMAIGVNKDLKLMGFVPVMVNPKTRMHRDIMDGIAKQYGRDKVFRGIRTDIKLAEAFAAGLPILRYAKSSRGASDYAYLFDQIGDVWPEFRKR